MSKFNFFGNISGQNVSINGEDIIINGKHVNNTDSNGEQIDEVRKAPTKIKKLYVSSNVRVNISEGHEDVIVSRLHGIASSKDFQFDIVPNSDSLRVTANIEGASSGGVPIINGTVISNSFNSLQLDIMLPLSSVEIISIQSSRGHRQGKVHRLRKMHSGVSLQRAHTSASPVYAQLQGQRHFHGRRQKGGD